MRVTQTVFATALVVSGVLAEAQTGSVYAGQSISTPAQKNALAGGQSPGQSPASSSSNQTPSNKVDSSRKVAPVVKAAAPQSPPATPKVPTEPVSKAAPVKEAAKPAAKVAAKETEKKTTTESIKTTVKEKVAEPVKAKAAEPVKKGKSLIEKASGVGKLLFGKPERTKLRTNAKKDAQYIRKQKSAAEIKVDASGTKQPASLSDPNVNVMEAFSDLVKRYAGQKNPDKSQFKEDITTVFESRAEKGDLTTKQYRQSYKLRKVTPNGVGKKRSVKVKRDLEEQLVVREADSDEFDLETREAAPLADPEAMVYEDEDFELVARKEESDEPQGNIENTDADEKEWDYEDGGRGSGSSKKKSSKGRKKSSKAKKKALKAKQRAANRKSKSKSKSKKSEDGEIWESDWDDGSESSSKKGNGKKKLSATRKAALKKEIAKKVAAKKKLMAMVADSKKKLNSKKSGSDANGGDGDIWESDWDDGSSSSSSKKTASSKSKPSKEVAKLQAEHQENLVKIAKLKSAIMAAQRKMDANHQHDEQRYNDMIRARALESTFGWDLRSRDVYGGEYAYGYGY